MKTFLSSLLRDTHGCTIRNERTREVIADHVIPAFDSATRRTGLLKHESLPNGHALVIAPCNAVHTCFMRFAIDVVFVARDGRVVKTRTAVRPWRATGALRGFATIELPAGTLARTGTRRGDVLSVSSGDASR
jgi:uncharacterized membrane protein (UPF0127 family)